MSAFAVETLTPDQTRSAFPLIREALPSLGLNAWLRFARQHTLPGRSRQAGIIAARRVGQPYPCGLFAYHTEQDLERGRVLIAEHFVAIDLLDPDAVLSALLIELDALGRRLGCGAVRSVVHGAANQVADGLAAAGHVQEGALLLKLLPNWSRYRGSSDWFSQSLVRPG
jgi:hypothetical protein